LPGSPRIFSEALQFLPAVLVIDGREEVRIATRSFRNCLPLAVCTRGLRKEILELRRDLMTRTNVHLRVANEPWRELCKEAQRETDPQKLLELLHKINEALLSQRARNIFVLPVVSCPPFPISLVESNTHLSN
jgi:hypothetical protein